VLDWEGDRIQIITVEELINGRRIDLPTVRQLVKRADAYGDSDKQQPLL
jgi:hypothetical protein